MTPERLAEIRRAIDARGPAWAPQHMRRKALLKAVRELLDEVERRDAESERLRISLEGIVLGAVNPSETAWEALGGDKA